MSAVMFHPVVAGQVIITDSEVFWDERRHLNELPLKVSREAAPFGYFIPPIRHYAIVSKSRGIIGFADDMETALPFCRMWARQAIRKGFPLDFRLYFWRPECVEWEVALDHLEI